MHYNLDMLNTGNYVKFDCETEVIYDFEPTKQTEIDNIDLRIWAVQILVWGLIVVFVKIMLYFFQLAFAPVLELIAYILIGWLKHYPRIKLILIMVIVPFLLNVFQFWIQDNFLKAKKSRNVEFSKLLSLKQRHSMFNESDFRFESPKV